MRLFATILFASVALCQAADKAAGRWEGAAQIPGQELTLIVDLSDEEGKGWVGSIIVPGFGVQGAPLVDLQVHGGGLPVSKELEGDYEMMGYTRHATMKFNIGAIFSAPLVLNGMVYRGSTDGNLYAID